MNISYKEEDYFILFKKGYEKGLGYYFDQYYPSLVQYAYSIVKDREAAEDLAMEVYIPLWERRESFKDTINVRAFLFLCVKNRALSVYRKNKSRIKFEHEKKYLGMENEENVLEKMISKERMEEALNAISTLPKNCQKVMRMLYIEGKSYKDIAKEMNLSINTIRTQRSRGIMLIKKYLLMALLFTSIHH